MHVAVVLKSCVDARPRLHVWLYMTCPTRKNFATLYFLVIKAHRAIHADESSQRVWPRVSAYGPAPKNVGREGMPDGPPCS